MAEENQTSKTTQTEKFPKPEGQFTISNLDTLKVFTDPLRLKIIELLMEQPRNVKFLANTLNIPSTKLYYHINMLEENGILKVVSTRVVSGIIEKLYQPVAGSFLVDRNLLHNEGEAGKEGLSMSLGSLFDITRDKVFESIKNGLIATTNEENKKSASLSFFSTSSRISHKRAAEFHQRLEELINNFNDCDKEVAEEGEETKSYLLTVVFFPTVDANTTDNQTEN